jgi:tol-pal system protein YbgF
MTRWARRLAPAAFLAAGACVASRSDIRLLQQDLAVMRAEAARADTARSAQLDRALLALARLDTLNDSLRVLSARLARFQGDVRENLNSMDQQLIQIQELTGQSQRRLQELRAGLEQRTGEAAGDSAGPPGPNQLLQIAIDQFRRGSAGAARAALEDLVRQHPESDVAPEAHFYIGETFLSERDSVRADSVYQALATAYPRSPRAATALYKHALILQAGGNRAGARQALQSLVSKYPRSDEAVLARDRLRALR